MAIGPAMVMGALGLLALVTMGRKGSAASAAPALPSGDPGDLPALPPSGSAVQKPVNTTGFVKAEGPIPVLLPPELAELMAKSLKDMTIQDDGRVMGPVTAESVQRATTVAAQIEAAGFPDAARAFRAWISQAAAKVPRPTPDKQVTLPGVSPAIVEQVNRAIQLERDPNKLRAILKGLEGLPKSPQRDALIEMLGETIKQVEAAIVMADTLKKTQEVIDNPGPPPATTKPAPVIELPPIQVVARPDPAPALPPVVTAPPKPVSEIADTPEARRAVNLANHLINRIADMGGDVKKAKGKEDVALVKSFQSAEGLTADGKMGPGSTLKLAKHTGDIPLVYYWPVGATSKNVLAYRDTLRQMADVHEQAGRPGIATKLRNAAARERGQGGIVGVMPA